MTIGEVLMVNEGAKILPSQLGRLRDRLNQEELDKQKSLDYIDNQDFFNMMCKYRTEVIEAESKKLPKPQIPDEIGTAFLTLAKNFSNRPCFIRYPFKEDMVSEAVVNCVKCINNYKIGGDASKNAFSYFTQVIYWAFLRKIKKEKKALVSVFKFTKQTFIEEDPLVTKGLHYSMDYMEEYIETYDKSNSEKNKKKRKKIKLENPYQIGATPEVINEQTIKTLCDLLPEEISLDNE